MKLLRNLLVIVAAGVLVLDMSLGAEKAPAGPPLDPATGLPIENVFDLNFPGGLVQHLVEAVEKACKMPLNVIIPEDHQDFFLPALKLRNVTVPQLFEAITKASIKPEMRKVGGGNNYQYVTTRYGFTSTDQRATANSIWYFFVENPQQPPAPQVTPSPPQCRFWQLEPYLEKLKVEDITTAIETGWKMLGVNPTPKLSFHKDTKLLIVVGQPSQLAIVDDVLRELTPGKKEQKLKPSPVPPGQAPGEKQ